jgi:hypothetical protein
VAQCLRLLQVFETRGPETQARVFAKVSHHGLTAVERVERDTFVLLEKVRSAKNMPCICSIGNIPVFFPVPGRCLPFLTHTRFRGALVSSHDEMCFPLT